MFKLFFVMAIASLGLVACASTTDDGSSSQAAKQAAKIEAKEDLATIGVACGPVTCRPDQLCCNAAKGVCFHRDEIPPPECE